MVDREPKKVLIVGGGPAGCAMALRLLQHGYTPTILERSSLRTSRVGEALLPEAEGLLKTLDVWERFKREDFEPTTGIVSAWGSRNLAESSFLFQPFSQGWNLDRARFDKMLLNVCADRGCHFACPLGPMRVAKAGLRWKVQTGSTEFQSDVLVDATGRSASIAARLGATRIAQNRLMALIGYLKTNDSFADTRLLIESVRDGWWYSAGLPNGVLVVAFLTDADQMPRHVAKRSAEWKQWIGESIHTLQRVQGATCPESLRLVNANTSWLDEAAGEGWFAVGDAAIALDPLSGNGMIRALKTGIAAADSVVAECSEMPTNRYNTLIRNMARTASQQCRSTYARENRWKESVFWHRRQRFSAAVDDLSLQIQLSETSKL